MSATHLSCVAACPTKAVAAPPAPGQTRGWAETFARISWTLPPVSQQSPEERSRKALPRSARVGRFRRTLLRSAPEGRSREAFPRAVPEDRYRGALPRAASERPRAPQNNGKKMSALDKAPKQPIRTPHSSYQNNGNLQRIPPRGFPGDASRETSRGPSQGDLTRGSHQGTVPGDPLRGPFQGTPPGDSPRGPSQGTLAGDLPRGFPQEGVTEDAPRGSPQGTFPKDSTKGFPR